AQPEYGNPQQCQAPSDSSCLTERRGTLPLRIPADRRAVLPTSVASRLSGCRRELEPHRGCLQKREPFSTSLTLRDGRATRSWFRFFCGGTGSGTLPGIAVALDRVASLPR